MLRVSVGILRVVCSVFLVFVVFRERNFREDGKREAEELGFPKSMTFWAFSVIQIVNKKLEKTSSK